MSSGMNKSNSARQIIIAMQLDSKPTVIKEHGIKTIPYKGYAIRISPQLVPGSKKITEWCVIGLRDVGIAYRSSLTEAKKFVDEQTEKTRNPAVRMVKTRKLVKPVLDCTRCNGSGVSRHDTACSLCKGTGVKK